MEFMKLFPKDILHPGVFALLCASYFKVQF